MLIVVYSRSTFFVRIEVFWKLFLNDLSIHRLNVTIIYQTKKNIYWIIASIKLKNAILKNHTSAYKKQFWESFFFNKVMKNFLFVLESLFYCIIKKCIKIKIDLKKILAFEISSIYILHIFEYFCNINKYNFLKSFQYYLKK